MTRLAAAFLEQASHCDKLGSAFMARLLRLVAQHWPIEGALAQRLEAWPGDIGQRRLAANAPCKRTARAGAERAISTVAERLSAPSHQRRSANQSSPDHADPPRQIYRKLAHLSAPNQRSRPQRRAYSSRNVATTPIQVADFFVRTWGQCGAEPWL